MKKQVAAQTEQSALDSAAVSTETASAESEVPTLSVDFKRAFEYISAKKFREVPVDGVMKTKADVAINVHTAFTNVAALASNTTEIVAIARQTWLNTMCSQLGISPEASKRNNKNENKAISTYGTVVGGTDSFEVDGENYRILGWLKWPVFRTESHVFVKYLTYILVMTPQTFEEFKKGAMLEDKDVVIAA